jgi:signal peptidase I
MGTGRRAAFAILALAALFARARRDLAVVTVRGPSMAPTLLPQDRVLVRRRRARRIRRGDIVAFRTPAVVTAGWADITRFGADAVTPDWLVKRVAALAGDPSPDGEGTVPAGRLFLLGDAAESMDSRHFGTVSIAAVRGVVVRPLPRRS